MNKNYHYSNEGWREDDLMDEMGEEPALCVWVRFMLMALALIFLSLLLGSCRTTRYVPVVAVRTDTVQITRHHRDSIFLHDSIHVNEKQKGDTVWLEVDRWHTRYIERETHDTLYVATHDTVPSPYPVPEYVEKQLSWWQQTRIHMGEALIAIIGIWLLWFFIKKKTVILTVIRAFVKF